MLRQYDAQRIVDNALARYKPETKEDSLIPELTFWDQGWRCNFTKTDRHIAACDHVNKRIIVSIPHLNARSEAEFQDTVRHELAHAIVGYGHGHNDVWINKAKELGLKDPRPCAASNANAGRAINIVETKEAPKIKAVQLRCPECGEVAEKVSEKISKSIITGEKIIVWLLKCGHKVEHDKIKDPLAELNTWTSASGKVIFPFQAEGIRFVGNANGRALIADEPGLGKTLQALGCLKFYPELGTCLWVCKATLKLQTQKEAIDWGGIEFFAQIIEHGKMYIIPNLNLYIVSMDLLRNIPTEKLDEIPFKTIIADEIQHFKNADVN